METQKLIDTVEAMLAPGKGVLAADESSGTIKRRFDSINVESTEENRRDYREMLFRTPGVSEFISGIILFDETLRQNGRLSLGECPHRPGHCSGHKGGQGDATHPRRAQ